MKNKTFYRNFFSIYIALVLQNVVTLSVNLADNMMLGAYSETSLAGVAAVNQIQFVYQQFLLALGDGLVIFCSQYWGKRQTAPMKKIAATAMHAGLLIAIALFVLVSLFFPAGGWNLYDGRPDHWGRGKVSSDYPFYLPVLCGDPAPSGGIKKHRDRQDRVPALHPYIFYKLRH